MHNAAVSAIFPVVSRVAVPRTLIDSDRHALLGEEAQDSFAAQGVV